MTLNDYQAQAADTAVYGSGWAVTYPTLGLAGEAGEVANKVQKVLRDRDGKFTPADVAAVRDEAGDVLWFLAALLRDLGVTFEDAAQANLHKLAARKANNTLSGSGDAR